MVSNVFLLLLYAYVLYIQMCTMGIVIKYSTSCNNTATNLMYVRSVSTVQVVLYVRTQTVLHSDF